MVFGRPSRPLDDDWSRLDRAEEESASDPRPRPHCGDGRGGWGDASGMMLLLSEHGPFRTGAERRSISRGNAMASLRTQLASVKRLILSSVGVDLFMRPQIAVHKERYGSEYGGWWIHPDSLGPTSIVYSFGVGTDVSFDLALIRAFGVRVHAFDPTPRSIAWIERQSLPPEFSFHPIGLAHFDGEQAFHAPVREDHVSYSTIGGHSRGEEVRAPVRRLDSILSMLGHDHVDLLKIDIEGAEYPALRDLVACRLGQILVEFHHGHHGLTARDTREAVRDLNRSGFQIFSVSSNGAEYSFLKTG
jgi:FkbM family methyltransferase